jgi:hypothetical protein
MIYRFICTLLRWTFKLYYAEVSLSRLDRLPADKPYIIVCRQEKPWIDAFVLAAHLRVPLYFIRPYRNSINLLRRMLMEVLHIVPLRRGWHKLPDDAQPHIPWSNLRWLITQNLPAVFFTEKKGQELKLTKGVAKIALHTEEVFDFALGVELIPVLISYEKRKLHISVKEGIRAADYENKYSHYAARTVREITNNLEESLRQPVQSSPDRPATHLQSTEAVS